MESGDRAWLDVEMELLHNVPSLIGEGNVERHKYFWYQERPHYVEWVSAPGREIAYGRMTAYYQPIWQEMQTLITRL